MNRIPAGPGQGERLRQARIAADFETATAAADRFGWPLNTYKANENGNAPFSFRRAKDYGAAFGVRAEWLYDGSGMASGPAGGGARVLGLTGASPGSERRYATGQDPAFTVPVPPGGSEDSCAVVVRGTSMRGFADDGALIYFEDQLAEPTAEMVGKVVVVETDDDQVLVKRLTRGGAPGLWDLESIEGETLRDVSLRWAALITAIVPPHVARRLLQGRV